MNLVIRPYSTVEFDAIYTIWQKALAPQWPLTPRYLERMVSGYARYQEGDHFVAEVDGRVVGFVATQADTTGKTGGIPLLMVMPASGRQGIGTLLHQAAIERLQNQGVEQITLAHGGGDYLWPGVPLNLPGAVDFFRACGWHFPDTSHDLTLDLADYHTPRGILERVAHQHIEIRLCALADEVAKVTDFEARTFPSWAAYYQMTADDGRYSDMLAAWDGDSVVGALLLDKGDINGLTPNAVWHTILGEDMGTIGAVGVDESYQSRGIGLAMVAWASEILQARGVRQCVIGWTDLLTFYGKLGYAVWRSYAMTED